VGKLNARHRTLRRDKGSNALQASNMLILPNAQIIGRNAALG
jgi:hypothetical protein